MSSAEVPDEDLAPSQTEGYKVGQQKTVAELAELDKEDESLQRWKASLGLGGGSGSGEKKVIPKSLFLESPTLKTGGGRIVLDLTGSKADLEKLKKEPLTIKEGVEYSVGITFAVQGQIVSGLKYLQVVKKAGIKVDKLEAMIGSYGPAAEDYTKIFAAEESPSGLLARQGSCAARSRIVDDDGHVWLDFEWGFKLAKEW